MGADGVSTAREANALLLPGDAVLADTCENGSEAAVIDGILRTTAVCYGENRAGVLKLSSQFARLYVPYEGDSVVGLVIDKIADGYTIDIQASLPAFIGATAFMGATRRNTVQLKPGDAIYARISSAIPGAQTQLTCAIEGYMPLASVSPYGRVTRGTLAMGAEAGVLFAKLAKLIPFRAYSGANGLLWTCGATLYDSITVQKCLEAPREMDAIIQERSNTLSRAHATNSADHRIRM